MSKRLELDHWFINEDSLSISLLRFYVNISKPELSYKLDIYQDSKVVSSLFFDTLEDAISFTEEVIVNCKDIDEINNSYQIQDKKMRKRTKIRKRTPNELRTNRKKV